MKPKVLGPALVIFGATFWGYLVLGELVIRLDFPERPAMLGLFGVFAAHCVLATSRQTYRDWLQRAVPALWGCGLLGFTLFLSATLMGTSGRSKVAAVTLLLWFLAAALYTIGRLLSPSRPADRPKLTWRSGERWLRVGAWVICCGFTAVALISVFDVL